MALVAQLAGDDMSRQIEREPGVVRALMLGPTQQDVAGRRPFQAGLEAPVAVEQDERDAGVGQPVHQRCGDPDMPEADHRPQVMQRHAQAGLVADEQPQRVVVQPQVAVGQRHVQGVEELHRQASSSAAKSSPSSMLAICLTASG